MRLTKSVLTRLVKSIALISLALALGACSSTITLDSEMSDTGDIDFSAGLSFNYEYAFGTLAVGDNLLVNESFKTTGGWENCGDASAYTIEQGFLTTNGTSCVYQTIPATSEEIYTLVCNSSADASYSEVGLVMLNGAYTPISEKITDITGKNTAEVEIISTAPAGTAFAAVTLYSEGVSNHGQCLLSATGSVDPVDPVDPDPIDPVDPVDPDPIDPVDPVDPDPVDPTPTNELLANSGFNANTDWFNCGNAANANISGGTLTLSGNSACVFQTVEATPNTTYNLACDSTSSALYSNVTLSMLDADFSPIYAETIPVNDTTAQPSVLASLKSTDATTYVAVTIYSEGPATHESCSLTNGVPVTPTPVDPTPVPVDPTPVDPTPVDPTPFDPTPVDPTPVDPTPVDPTPVDPTPGANSLLMNSSFDGTDAWTVCAGENQDNYGIGSGNFAAAGTACAFQTVPLTGASEYTLVCNAKSDALTSNISLSMLDANFDTLFDAVEPIASETLQTITLKLSPTTNATFVSVTLYNDEGTSTIADCGLVAN